MKFLITGASGFLGATLSKYLTQNHNVTGLYFTHSPPDNIKSFKIDIRNQEALKNCFDKVAPDIIIHLAAITSPDICEKDKEIAWQVNVVATFNIATLAKKYNCPLIYVSTDLVFGGDVKSFYTEYDSESPTSYYSLTKRRAEKIFLEGNGTVLRPGWMYGIGCQYQRSFFMEMIRKFKSGKTINLFVDQYRTPSYTFNLAQIIEEFSQNSVTGIFHVGGPQRLSRYEFGLEVCQYFGFDKNLCIPTKMDDMQLSAHRPKDCSLNSRKISQILKKTKLMNLHQSLNHMKDKL